MNITTFDKLFQASRGLWGLYVDRSERQTLKKINSLRHLANNIKGFNICVLESEKEKKVEMGQKKNICQNDGQRFSRVDKNIDLHIQEAQ